MCDICNSLFGHLSSCPERSSGSGVYCSSCESELDEGQTLITFPNGKVICDLCARELELYELLDYFEVDNVVELVEAFELCKTIRIGRWG